MRKWTSSSADDSFAFIWDKMWTSAFKLSQCVVQRETTIKILMFWYKTLEALHRQDTLCQHSVGDVVMSWVPIIIFFGHTPKFNPSGMV